MLALADPEEGLEVGTSFFWKLKNYVYMYISVSEIRLKSVISYVEVYDKLIIACHF